MLTNHVTVMATMLIAIVVVVDNFIKVCRQL